MLGWSGGRSGSRRGRLRGGGRPRTKGSAGVGSGDKERDSSRRRAVSQRKRQQIAHNLLQNQREQIATGYIHDFVRFVL